MARTWTFGQKIGAGFAATVALALVAGAVSIYALRQVVAAKDRVIAVDARNITDAERLAGAAAQRTAAGRAFLLSRADSHLEDLRLNREQFVAVLGGLRQRATDPVSQKLLGEVERTVGDHRSAMDELLELRKGDSAAEVVARQFEEEVTPRRRLADQAIEAFVARGHQLLNDHREAATATADTAIAIVLTVGIGALVLAIILAVILTRSLGRQVGTAVSQVQSSSAELQAAANQQATGAREQATAMNEITTTIRELLATSRQIAESAQRVAQIAEETAGGARSGDGTVDRGHDAVGAIRRQMDLIVNHMLELGRKSQQIGSVLDIVGELAEQTNILAINATIEAAGAGDAGRRFAVVAEEIRKLADRVGRSTKEIRGLIDDVRSAVNTTVMTTETGSKAVEAGARQFSEVASAFKQIAGLVGTTTEAAKEIELSTKQQATAVEQVNVAITNVAQASKENEASTGQTLQTASQLTGLARDLLRLVRPEAPQGNGGRAQAG